MPHARRELSNVNLDDLPDEEKACVLRRHLVSKDEREPPAAELEVPLAGGSGSRWSSSGANTPLRRGDTEPFPIPYHTPGADVMSILLSPTLTSVQLLQRWYPLLVSSLHFHRPHLYSFLLHVYTKFRVSGSFGVIGGTLYGLWMRYLILGSIVVSQIGFVAAYIIFVAQNLQALVMGLAHCQHLVDIKYFILVQLVVFLPLVLIHDLAKLSSTVLVADAFIFVGLVYIFGSEISIIATQAIADVQLFNLRDFSLFVGVAVFTVFTLEGVGVVIPITDAMREPHKFPKVLMGVMLGVLVLFGGAGALAYATFGSEIQTVVLVNLDAESKMVKSLFPAIRIMENTLFTRSGKGDVRVKWTKNVFSCIRDSRGCGAAQLDGRSGSDKFCAFIGCFAWYVLLLACSFSLPQSPPRPHVAP
ncbi:transmembrane amino acid transporter protein-domain-containing protein [Mycena olivaceomarginata]|nr:transmembrane amino acid transporter protein-domain-containing protein [Mycena olivaceomarginata]